jgi:hypothetical protein
MCRTIRKTVIRTEVEVSKETFLSHYGEKLKKAPKTLDAVPEDKVAVMLMDDYNEIHLAEDAGELAYLTDYKGSWYLIDLELVAEYL